MAIARARSAARDFIAAASHPDVRGVHDPIEERLCPSCHGRAVARIYDRPGRPNRPPLRPMKRRVRSERAGSPMRSLSPARSQSSPIAA
jgi:hypothetical protein